MAKISDVEVAALDQVAWEITKDSVELLGFGSTDVNEYIELRIEHFLTVRGQLLDAVAKLPAQPAGTWSRK